MASSVVLTRAELDVLRKKVAYGSCQIVALSGSLTSFVHLIIYQFCVGRLSAHAAQREPAPEVGQRRESSSAQDSAGEAQGAGAGAS